MTSMFAPIANVFTKFFEILHSLIIGMGVPDTGVSYVLTICLLTLIIRLILLPLQIKSANSTRKMQEIQPEVKKIQEKYKNDPQRANMEIMQLYKERKISMTGGCLPMLIQLPILMALYSSFYNMKEIQGLSFLWLSDLGKPDPLFILPVLAVITAYIPSKLMTAATPKDAGGMDMGGMNIGMALMSGFITISLGSMIGIYWVFGNLIQIVQTYFLNYRPAMIKQKEVQEVMQQEEELKKSLEKSRFAMDIPEPNKKKKKKK